jgi:malonyl-CoA O-methyltransferase
MSEIDEYSPDEYNMDKQQVRRAFSRAAASYDVAAVLQREVLSRMLGRLDVVALSPQQILDAGCGTGLAGRYLAARYNKSQVLGLDFSSPMLHIAERRISWVKRWIDKRHKFVCGDIEAMPVGTGKIDLVWSNLALQWCNDLDGAFREMHRVLRAEGLLMFSTFGPDTLKELRQATRNQHTHVNRFIDMHDIGDALVRAGFSAPVMDVERFTLTYDDVMSLMRDLKAIGANNATAGRPRGLEGRAFLRRVIADYEVFRLPDGKLPATFEVVYGHAWKPQPKLPDGMQPVIFMQKK